MDVSWAKVNTVEADRNLIVDKIIFWRFPKSCDALTSSEYNLSWPDALVSMRH